MCVKQFIFQMIVSLFLFLFILRALATLLLYFSLLCIHFEHYSVIHSYCHILFEERLFLTQVATSSLSGQTSLELFINIKQRDFPTKTVTHLSIYDFTHPRSIILKYNHTILIFLFLTSLSLISIDYFISQIAISVI